ncbi:nuclear transport factor 2 family protein [Chloroflexota bacterium]
MKSPMGTEQIRKLAKALDDAIESRNNEEIVSYFSDNCEIELLGVKLSGKEGLRKAIAWMYGYLKDVTLIPITIMVDGDTFFEEFMLKAKIKGGKGIEVKQAEVLVYDGEYKVKNLRLYFDRLELAVAYVSNPVEKMMVRQISKASLNGLI